MLDSEFFGYEEDFYIDRSFSGETAYRGGTILYSGSTYIVSIDPITDELTTYKRSKNGWFIKIINKIKNVVGMKMDKTKNREFQSWNKPSEVPNYFRLNKNRILKKPESPRIHVMTREKK